MIYKNKFDMTVEENIFVARRNIVDYIWKSANLEGIVITYPETDAIFNGINAPNIKVDDIIAINNLKYAWSFILASVPYPTDYTFICEINQYVGSGHLIHNAGLLRTLPVKISGTDWEPGIPIESEIKEELSEVFKVNSPTERAITLMLYCMRKQIFLDGNKRTAMFAGNHIMIANGAGIITVPIELQRYFATLLVKYYETNEVDEIKKFVYDNCIDGIPFRNQDISKTHGE